MNHYSWGLCWKIIICLWNKQAMFLLYRFVMEVLWLREPYLLNSFHMHMYIVSEISFILVFRWLIVIILRDFYLKINDYQYVPNIMLRMFHAYSQPFHLMYMKPVLMQWQLVTTVAWCLVQRNSQNIKYVSQWTVPKSWYSVCFITIAI